MRITAGIWRCWRNSGKKVATVCTAIDNAPWILGLPISGGRLWHAGAEDRRHSAAFRAHGRIEVKGCSASVPSAAAATASAPHRRGAGLLAPATRARSLPGPPRSFRPLPLPFSAVLSYNLSWRKHLTQASQSRAFTAFHPVSPLLRRKGGGSRGSADTP